TPDPVKVPYHRYNGSRIPVTLETFNSLTYLPKHLVEAISADLTQFWGPHELDRQHPERVLCNWFRKEHSRAKFTFGFKTEGTGEVVRIKVPVTDLIYVAQRTKFGDLCHLGIVETQEGNAALGTGVMKHGYWVLDANTTRVRVAEGMDCGSKVVGWKEGKKFKGECGKGRTVGKSGKKNGKSGKKNG
ncbi:hypothetical protein QBC41DRAFT_190191, partial [Cercophora samala]